MGFDRERLFMVKAIVAQNALAKNTNLVLYRNFLPQRTLLRHPSLRVIVDVRDHMPLEKKQEGDLCYDNQGCPTSFMRLGLLIDAYF